MPGCTLGAKFMGREKHYVSGSKDFKMFNLYLIHEVAAGEQPYINSMSAVCLLYVCCMSDICLLYISRMSAVCQPYLISQFAKYFNF